MALRKFTYISTEGYPQEQGASDELSLGKISLAGVGGIAIDGGGAKASNFGMGTASGDLVTKAQLDAVVNGLRDPKDSVRAVAASNVDIATGGLLTIDGVSLAEDDRVLLVGQTDASENGIYVVVDGGAWVRAEDADESSEVTPGMYTFAEEGTTYADTMWLLQTNGPITLDTTNLTFIHIPSLRDLVAGAGLSKTANTLDVNVGNGIEISSDAVAVKLSATPGLEFDSGALQAKPDTARGLAKDASGLYIDLATDPGLQFSAGKLDAKLLSTGGIQKDSNGLSIKIDNSPDTLDVDIDGLKVVGLPALFKVNDVAVGASVTAENLDDLTDGSDGSALHTHDSVKRVKDTHTVVEAVNAGDPVAWSSTANKLAQGDAGNDADSRIIGVALAAALADATTAVVKKGIAAGVLTGATPGTAYYLADGGGLSATPPSSGKRFILVGYAVNATDLELRITDYGKKI